MPDENFIYLLGVTNQLISVTYSSEDYTPYDVELKIYGTTIINDSILLCSDEELDTTFGLLECDISVYSFEDFRIEVFLNGKLDKVRTASLPDEAHKQHGDDGIFYAIIILIVFVLMFSFMWELLLIACPVSLMISVWLKFIPGVIESIVFLVLAVGYLIYLGGKKK